MSQTERLFRIKQLVKVRRTVSLTTPLDNLEVSRTTLNRDRAFLRDRVRAPMEEVRHLHAILLSLGEGRDSLGGIGWNLP